MNDDLQRYRPEKAQVRTAFDRAAATYDEAAVLQREVAARLLERLEVVKLEPGRVLDLGSGTGFVTADLKTRYQAAELWAVDLAPAMLQRTRRHGSWRRRVRCVCGDAEALPLRTESVDLVVSNLALQWCEDLDRAFAECMRVLRPGGLLMFSSFGPDTLRELRESWAAADGYSHVNAFVDMHDIGDALVRERFADPVMDVEHFTVTYPEVQGLMRDLKCIGAHNVTGGRSRGLTGRQRLRRMAQAYERFRDPQGRLPATYEVVYGLAWVPEAKPQRRDAAGAVHVPLNQIGRRGG